MHRALLAAVLGMTACATVPSDLEMSVLRGHAGLGVTRTVIVRAAGSVTVAAREGARSQAQISTDRVAELWGEFLALKLEDAPNPYVLAADEVCVGYTSHRDVLMIEVVAEGRTTRVHAELGCHSPMGRRLEAFARRLEAAPAGALR